MTASYRAVTALMLVFWIMSYIVLAWYIGGFIPAGSDFLALAYYPVAGLTWIFGAVWILKKRYGKKTE